MHILKLVFEKIVKITTKTKSQLNDTLLNREIDKIRVIALIRFP